MSQIVDPTPTIGFEYIRTGNRRSSFEARLLHASAEVIVMSHLAEPSKPLYHADEVVIERGYSVVWFLFKGQPYDIGRFYRPDGAWTGYYVDILEPVYWDEDDPTSIAPLIDLALDVWIAPDGSHAVLDEDEFAVAVEQGELTSPQADHARSTLAHLVASLKADRFPPVMVRNYACTSR